MREMHESIIDEIEKLVIYISDIVWNAYIYGRNILRRDYSEEIEILFSQIQYKMGYLNGDCPLSEGAIKAIGRAETAARREPRHLVNTRMKEIVDRLNSIFGINV